MGCTTCHDLNARGFHGTFFSAILTSAEAGCPTCMLLRDGITGILGHDNLGLVEITMGLIGEGCDKDFVNPLYVYVEDGSGGKAQVDFYTDDDTRLLLYRLEHRAFSRVELM